MLLDRRYETSLQDERSNQDPDRFSTTSSNRIPRGPPKRVESEKVLFLRPCHGVWSSSSAFAVREVVFLVTADVCVLPAADLELESA